MAGTIGAIKTRTSKTRVQRRKAMLAQIRLTGVTGRQGANERPIFVGCHARTLRPSKVYNAPYGKRPAAKRKAAFA